MSDREALLHHARVMLAECARRRQGPLDGRGHNVNADFYWGLFAWAQAVRRSVARLPQMPAQGGLFA
jgi:hypothetical protein